MSCGKLFFLSLFVFSCTEQHKPYRYWSQYERERELSIRKPLKLTEAGTIPSPEPKVKEAEGIDKKFANLCSSCHGADGHGDGPAAAGLNPKPRNFHDKAWQAKTDEAKIVAVLELGGAGVGLSALMTPFKGILSETEINEMAKKIKDFDKN